MPRTSLSSKFPSSKEDVPESKEVRVRIPGTVFETDEEGYVRLPAELLKVLLDNLQKN